MSLYRLQMFEPGHVAEVGYLKNEGYFYAIYEQGSTIPKTHGGLDKSDSQPLRGDGGHLA
jgi:hypothetical protein